MLEDRMMIGMFSDLLQDLSEIFDDLRGKVGKSEFLLNPQEFLFDRLPVLVLKGMEEVEVIPVQEFGKDS